MQYSLPNELKRDTIFNVLKIKSRYVWIPLKQSKNTKQNTILYQLYSTKYNSELMCVICLFIFTTITIKLNQIQMNLLEKPDNHTVFQITHFFFWNCNSSRALAHTHSRGKKNRQWRWNEQKIRFYHISRSNVEKKQFFFSLSRCNKKEI